MVVLYNKSYPESLVLFFKSLLSPWNLLNFINAKNGEISTNALLFKKKSFCLHFAFGQDKKVKTLLIY